MTLPQFEAIFPLKNEPSLYEINHIRTAIETASIDLQTRHPANEIDLYKMLQKAFVKDNCKVELIKLMLSQFVSQQRRIVEVEVDLIEEMSNKQFHVFDKQVIPTTYVLANKDFALDRDDYGIGFLINRDPLMNRNFVLINRNNDNIFSANVYYGPKIDNPMLQSINRILNAGTAIVAMADAGLLFSEKSINVGTIRTRSVDRKPVLLRRAITHFSFDPTMVKANLAKALPPKGITFDDLYNCIHQMVDEEPLAIPHFIKKEHPWSAVHVIDFLGHYHPDALEHIAPHICQLGNSEKFFSLEKCLGLIACSVMPEHSNSRNKILSEVLNSKSFILKQIMTAVKKGQI